MLRVWHYLLMKYVIRCTCGHQFNRSTICQKNLQTWECPKFRAWCMRNPKLAAGTYVLTARDGHRTHGDFR